MAEKSSRLRLDDFVAAVHADPANVEPTVLLAGYLGRSPEEGNVRVYLDPGLSSWLEVPEAEVIHSRPIADSPLGGSQLWVRASAQIKPGAPGAAAPPEGDEGGGDKPAVGSDTGVFNPMATIHPTLWTQFCPTGVGCIATIPCLPPSIGCPPPGPAQGPIGPTGWHTCACPATQLGCPNTVSCPPGGALQGGPTGWYTCVCPVGPTGTQGCGQGGLAAVGPTGTQGCTVPPHCVGPTGTQGCGQGGLGAVGPTGTQGCTQPGHCVGPTGWHTCACPIGPTGYQGCVGAEAGGGQQSTAATLCTRVAPCVGQTGWHTCACPIGPTGYQGCGVGGAAQIPNDPTASTMCFICPPITLDPTSATRCFICPPLEAAGNFAAAAQPPLGPTGTQGCTQPGHCVGQTGWHTCACPPGAQVADISVYCATLFCNYTRTNCADAINPTASTRCFVCPPMEAAAFAGGAQAGLLGPTGTQGCTVPPHCFGPTGTQGCAPALGSQQSTAATLCTRVGCQQGGPVITLVTAFGCPHPSWIDACPTRICLGGTDPRAASNTIVGCYQTYHCGRQI